MDAIFIVTLNLLRNDESRAYWLPDGESLADMGLILILNISRYKVVTKNSKYLFFFLGFTNWCYDLGTLNFIIKVSSFTKYSWWKLSMMIFFGQSKEIEQDLVIAFNLRKLILTEKFPQIYYIWYIPLIIILLYFRFFAMDAKFSVYGTSSHFFKWFW